MNFPVKPVVEEIKMIADLGFDYLELTMDPPQAHYNTPPNSLTSKHHQLISMDLQYCSFKIIGREGLRWKVDWGSVDKCYKNNIYYGHTGIIRREDFFWQSLVFIHFPSSLFARYGE